MDPDGSQTCLNRERGQPRTDGSGAWYINPREEFFEWGTPGRSYEVFVCLTVQKTDDGLGEGRSLLLAGVPS